ncbi:MAG: hypothetical protein GY866_27280 [Proteobacteria bacterium]|nr:hypothetical protein [Pseudomonadota bacterium]
MRKRLVGLLDYKERQWLHKAIMKMIVADKSIAQEEVDDLKETLKMLAGTELKDLKKFITSSEFSVPLQPLKNIEYEHAFIIVMEIARVAAIDSKVVLDEAELLKEILSLLDFNKAAVNKVMDWTKKLALINQEEDRLKDELKNYFSW